MEMETPDDTRYRARQIALDERGIDALRGARVRRLDPPDGRRAPQLPERAALVGMTPDGAEADAGDARSAHRAAAARCRRSTGT
jgi:hypothetical protein